MELKSSSDRLKTFINYRNSLAATFGKKEKRRTLEFHANTIVMYQSGYLIGSASPSGGNIRRLPTPPSFPRFFFKNILSVNSLHFLFTRVLLHENNCNRWISNRPLHVIPCVKYFDLQRAHTAKSVHLNFFFS